MTVQSKTPLAGHRALVTGVSSGIGAAIAKSLAAAGDTVVAMVRRSAEAFGSIDILVNNAGLQKETLFPEFRFGG